MDAVRLDGAWDTDQVFVDHRYEGWMVPGSDNFEDGVEGLDVVRSIIWRQGDASEQHTDMCTIERSEDSVKVVARLVRGKSAESIVAAEFNDDDAGAELQNGAQVGNGVLRGCAACAAVR